MRDNKLTQKSTFSAKKFIIEACIDYKWYVLGQLIIMIGFSLWITYWPYLEKQVTETLIKTPVPEAGKALWPIFAIYIGLGALTGCLFRYYDWLFIHFDPLFKRNIILKLTQYVWGHSHLFFQESLTGSLSNKIIDIAENLSLVIKNLIEVYLFTFIYFIWLGFSLFYLQPMLCLIIISWCIIFVCIAWYFAKIGQPLAMIASETRSVLIGKLVDSVANVGSIRLFNAQRFEYAHLKNTFDVFMSAVRKRDWLVFWLNGMQSCLFTLLQIISFSYLIYAYTHHKVSLGDFVLMFGIISNLFMVLWNISKQFSTFNENVGVIRQGLHLISMPHQIADTANSYALKLEKGAITFQNVNFKYTDKNVEPFFNNKSIVIEGGQKVGLVGYSGSGKTTFVNLILRLYDIQSGTILIDGQNIQSATLESLYDNIGLIPQDPSLFHRTIFENIQYGCPTASKEEVLKAAKAAHAHEFIMQLSDEYETEAGERGIKLSGGQRQRISIARAFLKDAPILILDEATSQLDSITENDIQESLWQLMHNKTTLVIAHRLSTLLDMDRILVFDKGKIIQDGPHKVLLAEPGLYKTLWNAQIGGMLPDFDHKTEQ